MSLTKTDAQSSKAPKEASYQAEFLLGAVSPSQYPEEDLPEIAFAGRSNAGKSSLLNSLLNRRKLARVSSMPGRTRELNFFLIDKSWRLVDLPGYGFARVDRRQRNVWEQGIGDYLSTRRNLRAVALLLDIRRGVTDHDEEMLEYLFQRGIPVIIVATKIDKLKANPRRAAMQKLKAEIKEKAPLLIASPVATSSLDGKGMPELRALIKQVLET
ncbi:ribosome biogenesis GTP-binding protein YihA/YsxC [Magnetofaba australis]|uniref:Probable GTP-binding protein EngB n=1 Tax=Magnetofaba australis IT-1 TaxID=1434232 RepID=A0A1Y2K7A3_9PROT|nr:ribosome biogenesis GTP-binding protein YihA/YsxC [Magnetofaba australis]OSM06197.1 putative small GTP-binding protein [Magnetofaba australis IT-1]